MISLKILVNLDGGTFIAPSGLFNISKPNVFGYGEEFYTSNQTLFNHISGNFVHNNGTVRIAPWVDKYLIFTIDVLPSTRFYNLTNTIFIS